MPAAAPIRPRLCALSIGLVTALAALAPSLSTAQDVTAGERLFRQRCVACHAVQPGRNLVGPHLAGIAGRKAGSVEGARYSQALQKLDITWDAAQLDKYLAGPTAMVPGTTMPMAVPNAAERTNLVAYLQSLAAGR